MKSILGVNVVAQEVQPLLLTPTSSVVWDSVPSQLLIQLPVDAFGEQQVMLLVLVILPCGRAG